MATEQNGHLELTYRKPWQHHFHKFCAQVTDPEPYGPLVKKSIYLELCPFSSLALLCGQVFSGGILFYKHTFLVFFLLLISTGKEVCMLNDKVWEQKLKLQRSDDNTSLDEMFFLDDTRIISYHYDNVIRVFDYMQGKFIWSVRCWWNQTYITKYVKLNPRDTIYYLENSQLIYFC